MDEEFNRNIMLVDTFISIWLVMKVYPGALYYLKRSETLGNDSDNNLRFVAFMNGVVFPKKGKGAFEFIKDIKDSIYSLCKPEDIVGIIYFDKIFTKWEEYKNLEKKTESDLTKLAIFIKECVDDLNKRHSQN